MAKGNEMNMADLLAAFAMEIAEEIARESRAASKCGTKDGAYPQQQKAPEPPKKFDPLETAKVVKSLNDAFCTVGFDDRQAFELTRVILANGRTK